MRRSLYEVNRERSIGFLFDLMTANRIDKLSKRHAGRRKHKMAIFANDHIGIAINLFGLYEKEQLEVLFSFLAPLQPLFSGGVALDIGANIGNHTLYFADHFRHIHAFEPNPAAYHLLKFNIAAFSHLTAHPFGLGDAPGRYFLHENPTNLGGSAIAAAAPGGDQAVEITVMRLDDCGLELGELCFLKLDVEGFEARVIAGASRTIAAQQPLIVLEQRERDFIGGTTQAISLLQALGYQFCWHQGGTRARNRLLRRVCNMKEAFIGRRHRIWSDERVPPGNYPMLIAVPPRFRGALGLTST